MSAAHDHPPVDYTDFRITSLWAWTQIGEDGEEGILSFTTSTGTLPMIASDRIRLDDLRPMAESIAHYTRRPVKLSRFDIRVDLEEIQP